MEHDGSAFDPELAKRLVECCNKIYQWHAEAEAGPANPEGFDRAPLIRLSISTLGRLSTRICDCIRERIRLAVVRARRLYAQLRFVAWQDDGPRPDNFGVLYTSKRKDFNVLAFRGTEGLDDGLLDLEVEQDPLPLEWRPAVAQGGPGPDPSAIKVHHGFLARVEDIREQIVERCEGLEGTPMYVTGHSLGAAVAVLVAVMLRVELKFSKVIVYTFAGPRVGNAAFADYFDVTLKIPCYRVVNLADVIPELPPPELDIPLPTPCIGSHQSYPYKHVRAQEQWSFLNQTNNPFGNHALMGPNNYHHCVKNGILSRSDWAYPVAPPSSDSEAEGF